MLAVISDLHSNLEALEAVLADADARGADEVVCLGDVVGYGPSPAEVADLVRDRASACVRGNHDEALLAGGLGFRGVAKRAIDWTREQLRPGFFTGGKARRRWEWLTTLPDRHVRGDDLFLHGSPCDPTSEYLLASEAPLWSDERRETIFSAFGRLLFVGHSHLPCLIDDALEARTAASLGNSWRYPGKGKAILNPGSVGQPRDGDGRASYILQDGDLVLWRRVPYDVERAARRIEETPGLDATLGERLRVGR